MRVLIADDDDTWRPFLRALLMAAGYEVLAEADGALAWERLNREGADLCVFDVNMPGMNGMELLGRLRNDARFRELPVLILTGEAVGERLVACYGACDYMAKPADPEVLLARIAALAGRTGPPFLLPGDRGTIRKGRAGTIKSGRD